MSSAGNYQPSSPSGHARPEGVSTVIAVPIPGQRDNGRPLSKHEIAMKRIMQGCSKALKAKEAGEITHDEFMVIANDCIERARALNRATDSLNEQAERGEVSLEDYNRECGYTDEDREKLQIDIEREQEFREVHTRRSHASLLQNKKSRGR
ncbi:hypothetical protein DENSPDRAFT_297242 [Dentipellis sp. KUC8613]|nr:hypothetical protein DENSPDRAFT_297242 [Dentipellis sp. KUC8613]